MLHAVPEIICLRIETTSSAPALAHQDFPVVRGQRLCLHCRRVSKVMQQPDFNLDSFSPMHCITNGATHNVTLREPKTSCELRVNLYRLHPAVAAGLELRQ